MKKILLSLLLFSASLFAESLRITNRSGKSMSIIIIDNSSTQGRTISENDEYEFQVSNGVWKILFDQRDKVLTPFNRENHYVYIGTSKLIPASIMNSPFERARILYMEQNCD